MAPRIGWIGVVAPHCAEVSPSAGHWRRVFQPEPDVRSASASPAAVRSP